MRSATVAELSVRAAERMGLDEHDRRQVELVAQLHDVGNVAVPHEIVEKPGPLSEHEWAVVREHPIRGQELLEKAGGELRDVGVVVRASHERWDGLGYPDGISGPSIPLAARIVSCCVAFVAMTSERPYRERMSSEAALRELVDNVGFQFDALVVRSVIAVVRGIPSDGLPDLVALVSERGDRGFDRAGARALAS